MRLNDLNDGSIKTLLILALLAANVAVALPPRSARVARVGFRRLAETNFPSDPPSPPKYAMAITPSLPQSLDETRSLPNRHTP